MVRYLSLLIIFFTLAISANSQVLAQVDARLFKIVSEKGDTIEFLKTDTCLVQRKPTILFCQGSLPIPLVLRLDSARTIIASLDNFDYRTLSKKYNIVVISMPHTPAVVSASRLNKSYQYLNREGVCDSLYRRDNYLENYLARANCVLTYLRKQPWVDSEKIAVIGHSQGAYIATAVATQNPDICALGYSSGDPEGRITLYVRAARRLEMTKSLSPEQVQDRINGLYHYWKLSCSGDEPDDIQSDPIHTWLSFSISQRAELIKLKIPVLIVYGTADFESSEGCDVLPIYFESAGKHNYQMMPFVGCGHNFEDISSQGIPSYKNMYAHWNQVMNSFAKMIEDGNSPSH